MTTTLEILRSGPLALVEDLGRPGLAHMGVSRSGAADRRSHTLANRLVANPGECATIEVTFGGLSARVRGGEASPSPSPEPTPTRRSTGFRSARTAFTTPTTAR